MNKRSPIENDIYAALVGVCEQKEHEGSYKGNGHHLAQKLTIKVSEALLPESQKKIYDQLTMTPTATGEIADKCGIPSKDVSAQLINIYKRCLLVGFKKVGKNKLWHRMNSSD